MAERLYMDWNATAPLLAAARQAMLAAHDLTGNPSSVHREGRAARAIVDKARREVAALCGAEPAHVVFTSGATEAAQTLVTPDWRMGKADVTASRLYLSGIEHKAVREPARFPAARIVTLPATAGGVVDLGELERQLAAHDRSEGLPLVALMLANNETGIIQPVADAAKLVRQAGGILVVDAVQAAGRIPLSIAGLDADFLILSSHKIGGPKGVGAIIGRGEMLWPRPLIAGGGQEKGHRSGTENVAGLAGFGAAAAAVADGIEARAGRMRAIRARIEAGLLAASPLTEIIGQDRERLANTIFVTHPGLKAETGQIAFDLDGIAVSAGSACSSGKVGESQVLTAMGRDGRIGGLRISFGPETTGADADRVVAAWARIIGRLKGRADAA